MTIGEKIRQLRTDKGLTQETLATELGLSRQAIAKWEAGQSIPSTDNLMKISDFFGISLAELVDANNGTLSSLEEYAYRKLEEEKTKQIKKVAALKKLKKLLVLIAFYVLLAVICFLLFYLCGAREYVWDWMNEYYILPITCAFSIAYILLDRNIAGYSLAIGSVLALIVGNIAGSIGYSNSVIGFENGWVFYLATLFLIYFCGYAMDIKTNGFKNGSLPSYVKSVRIAMAVLVLIIFALCIFLAERRIKFGIGGEAGFLEAYEVGKSDAENGKERDNGFGEEHAPEQYTFGSSEFVGFARYWPEGYDAGYDSAGQ